MSRNLILAWTSGPQCSSEFAGSLVSAVTSPRVHPWLHQVVRIGSGPVIANARNRHVRRLLDSPAEWLLQLDADMVFTPDALACLIESGHPDLSPIVGGLYSGTGETGTDPWPEAGWFTPDGFRHLDPGRASGLADVDFVGAGALMVHRRVFEDLATRHDPAAPWFAEAIRDGRIDGEDWEFCRRATEAGYPVLVNTDARFGHVKTGVLWPAPREDHR